MEIKKILVIFKTHLDIGFTDFSDTVTKKYMSVFIPNAIRTANELRESGTDAHMIWTTGSWLIYKYLKTFKGKPEEKILCDAIERGDIRWHALPFTTHTELMSPQLFEYGISYSQGLDARFNQKTIAAKLTDVPGHTKAMIPYLKKAGIQFLHIGVNEASAVPDVPEIFKWQCDSGESVIVMYNGDYGKFTPIGDTGTAVMFAHTGDNLGCQSAEDTIELFKKLHADYPEAAVMAGTLDDVANEVNKIADTLPTITDEIGDSWIHGAGTDPIKTQMFRKLEQVWINMPEGEDKVTLGDGIIMIPEHTWGLDEKTHLHDNVYYKRTDFERLRSSADYQKMEKSWQEQRSFMLDAVEKLSEENKKICLDAISDLKPIPLVRGKAVKPFEKVTVKDCEFVFNKKGECISLVKNGKVIADENHPLFTFIYENFSCDDFEKFRAQYHRITIDWAIEDFTKVGMDCAIKAHRKTTPDVLMITAAEDNVTVYLRGDSEGHKLYGEPLNYAVKITPFDKGIHVYADYRDKPASRVAEAIWFGFKPIAKGKKISKMGTLIDPTKVASRGGRRLCATDKGVFYDNLSIQTTNAVLVAPGEPSLVNFSNLIPADEEGVYFNLFNNTWGTNFPMWSNDDARFDFDIITEE